MNPPVKQDGDEPDQLDGDEGSKEPREEASSRGLEANRADCGGAFQHGDGSEGDGDDTEEQLTFGLWIRLQPAPPKSQRLRCREVAEDVG